MNPREGKQPTTLAERFWSLARGMEGLSDSTEPVAVVEHVMAVLDALDAGKVGRDLTANTINFLALLRQYEVKGDLLYASPEQARGEQVDERSLVFSVGVLLFEKLTGRHPFGAEGNPQRLARIRRGEMASGVNYFPKVPEELRVVLLRAMGPFPEERWNTLAELRVELERFVERARRPSRDGELTRTRPLPALPGGETHAARRRPAPRSTPSRDPAMDLSRMATMSGRHSALRPEAEKQESTREEESNKEKGGEENARSQPARPRLSPGVWALTGVAAGCLMTSAAFLAAWPRRPSIPAVPAAAIAPAGAAEDPTAPARDPAANPGPTAGPAVNPASPASRGSAANPASTARPGPAAIPPRPGPTANPASTAPGPTANRTEVPTATPIATQTTEEPGPKPRGHSAAVGSGAFDPDAGGQAALTVVHRCVAADRTVQFGASLLYDAGSGLSRRVYFGAIKHLHAAERSCLEKNLLALPAGGRPDRPTVVTYSFRLDPTGADVKARLKAH